MKTNFSQPLNNLIKRHTSEEITFATYHNHYRGKVPRFYDTYKTKLGMTNRVKYVLYWPSQGYGFNDYEVAKNICDGIIDYCKEKNYKYSIVENENKYLDIRVISAK